MHNNLINAGINPLDNLKVHELRMEIEKRGLLTARKKKPQLENEFNELRRGITNVPALLQGTPETPLEELCLANYEISPVEPLHDLKGHLSNIIEELRVSLTGNVREKVDVIVSTVLGKETLRGSDYRKAAILILKTLLEFLPNSSLTTMLSMAVEITELLYCDPSERTSQSVLRLHNVAFVHAKLCTDLFPNPKTVTPRRMFGRYFHALTTHAPLLHRIISPCLLNTELEERMFGQCKAITRNTSNQHTNHIITNILVRLHSEEKAADSEKSTVKAQESEILKLAKALPPKQNTVIPLAWLQNSSVHYQAHLERISDYLLQGAGMWWRFVSNGVEFFDAHTPNPLLQAPPIHHFRSTSMGDVDVYLLSKWEQCLDKDVQLPAYYIRAYEANGGRTNIRSYLPHDMQVNPVTVSAGQAPSDLRLSCMSHAPAQTLPNLSGTPCTSHAPAQILPDLSGTPCTLRAPAQILPDLSGTPCTLRAPAQILPDLSATTCTSRAPAQTLPDLSGTPCMSLAPAQILPDLSATPCTSRAPAQTLPDLSGTPCMSRAPAQILPDLSGTQCMSRAPVQTLPDLSGTPCTSRAPVQTLPEISGTPCTSRSPVSLISQGHSACRVHQFRLSLISQALRVRRMHQLRLSLISQALRVRHVHQL